MDERDVATRCLRMRTLLLSLLAATACSSPRKPAVTRAPVASVRNYPAPLYAGLFVKGATHTYTVETRYTHSDDQDPRASANGEVTDTASGSITCTVTDVREVPSAIASSVECDNPNSLFLLDGEPAGFYVATADGLWSVGEMPKAAPPTTKGRLFASAPVAGAIEEPDPAHPGWGTRTDISRLGADGWCRYFTFISGDDGDEEVCVRDGILVGGSKSSSGGSSYEMRYALAKT